MSIDEKIQIKFVLILCSIINVHNLFNKKCMLFISLVDDVFQAKIWIMFNNEIANNKISNNKKSLINKLKRILMCISIN